MPKTSDRLKAGLDAMRPAAPSMIPAWDRKADKPKAEEEPKPNIREVISDLGVRSRLKKLIREIDDDARAIAAIEKEREEKKGRVRKELDALDLTVTTFESDGIPVNRYAFVKETIDAKLLASSGVAPSTIVACTKRTPVNTLQIGDARRRQP